MTDISIIFIQLILKWYEKSGNFYHYFRLVLYYRDDDGSVAQSVEQRTENPCVGGSIPPGATLNPNGNAGVYCFKHYKKSMVHLWYISIFWIFIIDESIKRF